MLRRLSVRGKILATLAVPVLVLVFAAVFISAQSLREVQVTRAITGALDALQVNRVYVENLQVEREAGVLHAGEIRLERRLPFMNDEERLTAKEEQERAARAVVRAEAFETATAASDATKARAQTQLQGINFDALDPLVVEGVNKTIEAGTRLADVRASVESGNLAPNLVDRQYSLILNDIIQFTEQFATTIDNRTLGTHLAAYAAVDQTIERIVNERGFGKYALEGDGLEASARDHLTGLFPPTDATHTRAMQTTLNLGNDELVMPDWGAESEAFTDFQNLRGRLQVSEVQDWAAVSEVTWVDQATIEINALEPTRVALWNAVQRHAATAQSTAFSQATLTVLLALAALVASVAVALLIGRTIVVPLARLTTAAGEVRDQLPRLVAQVATPGEGPDLTLMQIPVESTDEIGALAAAFNEVNQKTVEVAQEQAALRGSIAEMFVNVARRDQVLLNRQLSFIDTLEREEEDPNTLSNLFRLDHLATRMRRNAESLLVLAGIDSGRRVRGSMTLSDVIRTASSEIEQYDRINLQLTVDPHMHGFNSLPAAHLLAEIMENATVFSEPGTPVDVITSAEIEFITVTVIDRGLGMSADDIKEANQRIRQTTASDVIGAQRLGLHVVGRLAGRLGTKVVFAPAEGEGGTEVRVRFPRALFVDDAKEAQPTSGGRVLSATEAPAPVAVPVDLEALTDGQTGLGLPRRRASDAPAAAPAAPAASATEIPADSTAGLPTRRNFVLPEVATPTLAPDVAAAAAAGWAPEVAAPAASGLPSRSPRSTAAALPVDDGPVAPPRPAAAELAPEQRSGMFAGFRRGSEALDQAPQSAAEPAAVPAAELAPEQRAGMFAGFRRGAEALEPASDGAAEPPAEEASAPPAELPRRSEPQFTVPTLQPDADEAAPAAESDAPTWGQSVDETRAQEQAVNQVAASEWAQSVQSAPEAPEWSEQPAAQWQQPVAEEPAAQWQQPVAEQPVTEWQQPVAEEPAAQWQQPVAEQPATEWQQPVAEQPAPEAWAGSAPTSSSPYAPSAPDAPAWGEPAAPAATNPMWDQPRVEPSWEQPAAPIPSWGTSDPAWSPADPAQGFGAPQRGSYEQAPAHYTESAPAPYAEQPVEQSYGEQPVEQSYVEQPVEQSYAEQPVEQPYAEPEAPAAAAFEPQYPAFSPDAGYAAPAPAAEPAQAWQQTVPALEPDPTPAPAASPATWSAPEPVEQSEWNTSETPAVWGAQEPAPQQAEWQAAAPAADESTAPAWFNAGSQPSAASAPEAYAPAPQGAPGQGSTMAAPLPAFSDLVGAGGDSPSRRSRRDTEVKPEGKLSRAERRAAKRAEAKARAEEKALAKANARAAKKGRGRKSEPAPLEASAPDTPSTGFFSQPSSIAALRTASAPSAAAPAPASPSWSAPAASAEPAATQPQHSETPSWNTPAPQAPAAAPAPATAQQSFQPAFQPRPDTGSQPVVQPQAPTPAPAAAPSSAGATSFSPAPAAWTPAGASGGGAGARQFGVLDDEVAAMLALRSDIQEQALSELSQLSAYRPQVVKPAASLTRRTPTAIPSAPEMAEPTGESAPRDPEQLRSRLSSFQSGTSRGRRAEVPPLDPASSSDGAAPKANGSAEHAAPGAAPSDSAQEAQTW